MAVIYRPTDYLYLSARLRAREASLVGKERLSRLCALKDADEVIATLISEGILPSDAKRDIEGALTAPLQEAYDILRESAPDPTLYAFLQYPTDCHNIKSVLKCHYRGVAADGLLMGAGSVPAEELLGLVEGIPTAVPQHMKEAIPEARTAFERSGDPREIDFILDAACFADMWESAEPLEVSRELVSARADMINLASCRRLLRMGAGVAGAATLAHAYLPCGTVEKDELLALYEAGENAFAEYVARSAYAFVFEADTPTELERRADDLYMQIARRAAQTPFGAEVLIGYLVGVEYAVKNLRILLTAKSSGADRESLGGRLRESYV